MTKSHKGSRLALNNQAVPVKFNTAHFNFKEDATGVHYGELVSPIGTPVFSLRKTEGKFGGALAVEEATVNCLASGTSGYSALNPSHWHGVTLTTVGTSVNNTPILSYNTAVYQYIYTHDYILSDDLATLSSSPIVFSIYIRRVEGNATGRIRAYDNISGYSYHSVSTTTEFQRFEMTKVIGANPTRMFVMIDNTGGGTYEFHSPQLEKKAFSTSFVNGTRGNGKLEYQAESVINLNEGSFSCWFKPSSGFLTTDSWNRIIGHSTSVNINEIELMRKSNTDKLCFAISNASGTPASGWDIVSSTTSIVANTWYNITCTWSKTAGETRLYINGVLEGSLSGISSSYFPSAHGTIGVGYHQNYQRVLNGIISELRIDTSVPNEEEARSWYESRSPHYNPYDYRGYVE
jgi:hypothetical protein